MSAQDLLVEVGDPGSATTLASNYTAGDTSITVASTANWPTTGKAVIFAIDNAEVVNGVEKQIAGTYNEFEGTVASATSVTNVDWKRGAGDTNYDAGSLTRVYIPVSAERENRIVTWGTAEHNQDGTHSDVTATSVTATTGTFTNLTISGTANDGWTATGGTHSVSTGYNSGNRSFLINTSTDLSGIVSEGMRYRVTRDTTPPTQCADLESSSSHYASKSSPTGITFTDDFTCEAWVKLESYGTIRGIVSRYNGTSGWTLLVLADGTVRLQGNNGGSGNVSYTTTYQSIPLNKWVHISAVLDMSTFTATGSPIYIDGVSVPVAVARSGTNPTTISQAGNLEVGAYNGGTNPFDGKLADVRVWSDIRTATEIQDNMYNYPSDTTGLVAHFKLNGDFTDASSNGNDLTAQNSATATNADNPWNATEYGVITNVTSSTIQVFCPEGYGIPNETLSAPFYSTQSAPFGFPRDKGKWTVFSLFRAQTATTSNANYGAFASGGWALTVPIGAWSLGYDLQAYGGATTASYMNLSPTSITGTTIGSEDLRYTCRYQTPDAAATNINNISIRNSENITSAQTWTFYSQGATTANGIDADNGPARIIAECAYV